MDQDHGLSRSPDRNMAPEAGCLTCAVAQRLVDHDLMSDSPYVPEHIDGDVIVISGPELDGLVVVPRQHVGGLDELSQLCRAHVLAALRRATRSVLERNTGSETTVVVITDPPASEGHACFQVLPAARWSRGAPRNLV
jgi:hypothetical protein